jgi:hypothetical protein
MANLPAALSAIRRLRGWGFCPAPFRCGTAMLRKLGRSAFAFVFVFFVFS